MKYYSFHFGAANPSVYTGLTPTFLLFNNLASGASLARPGITEIPAASGIYRFLYEPVNLTPIIFLIDGTNAITVDSDRYITANLDTIQQVDQVLGFTNSSIGSTATDPVDLYGLLKREQEILEGDATFNKTTGVWDIMTRGGTTIQTKVLTNSTGTVTKT